MAISSDDSIEYENRNETKAELNIIKARNELIHLSNSFEKINEKLTIFLFIHLMIIMLSFIFLVMYYRW